MQYRASPTATSVLVLDLDETLIHTVFPYAGAVKSGLPAPHYRYANSMGGYLRPGLKQFLAFAQRSFTHVGVWTAASPDYAQFIVDQVLRPLGFAPKFLLTGTDCEWVPYRQGKAMVRVKPLRKLWTQPRFRWLGATEQNTLIVDDRHETAQLNPRQLVALRPFNPALHDAELVSVQQRLTVWLASRSPTLARPGLQPYRPQRILPLRSF
jgi:hypothetical protein